MFDVLVHILTPDINNTREAHFISCGAQRSTPITVNNTVSYSFVAFVAAIWDFDWLKSCQWTESVHGNQFSYLILLLQMCKSLATRKSHFYCHFSTFKTEHWLIRILFMAIASIAIITEYGYFTPVRPHQYDSKWSRGLTVNFGFNCVLHCNDCLFLSFFSVKMLLNEIKKYEKYVVCVKSSSRVLPPRISMDLKCRMCRQMTYKAHFYEFKNNNNEKKKTKYKNQLKTILFP